MTRICFISDTHTYHRELVIPECDILVHSGDYSFTGTIAEVNSFMTWFSEQKCSHRIVVNGNHEKIFWRNPSLFMSLIPDNVIYLEDAAITVGGLNFYGSPHTREFGGWAYPYMTQDEAQYIWDKVPTDTDILVTHMPPYGIRDGAPYKQQGAVWVPCLDEEGWSVGCEILLEKTEEVKPLVHVFGHIHEGRGTTQTKDTLFINASICTGQYEPTNLPIVVEIDENKTVKIIQQ